MCGGGWSCTGMSSNTQVLPSMRVEKVFDEHEVMLSVAEANAAVLRKHRRGRRRVGLMLEVAAFVTLSFVVVLWPRRGAVSRRHERQAFMHC